jgi:hypothetical protein
VLVNFEQLMVSNATSHLTPNRVPIYAHLLDKLTHDGEIVMQKKCFLGQVD